MDWSRDLASPLPDLEDLERRQRQAELRPPSDASATAERTVDKRAQAAFFLPGSDRFAARDAAPEQRDDNGGVTLNFENTSILEIVKVVLGDLLGENYVVDPGVQGTATLQTSKPLPREDLLATLELLLRMNGAAVVRGPDMFHIVPREQAAKAGRSVPQLGSTQRALPKGYSVLVVPLDFISVSEMEQILEPFIEPGVLLRVDRNRNLLVLAGSGVEVEQVVRTVEVFDVDWMKGMSFGLFTPDFVSAEDLATELETVFRNSEDGPLADLLQFQVIERLNALLVITPRRAYLNRVGEWVRRLDRDSGQVGKRLFVYHVQNGKAADLATVLTDVLGGSEEDNRRRRAEVAPGLEAAQIQGRSRTPNDTSNSDPDRASRQQNQPRDPVERGTARSNTAQSGEGVALGPTDDVRVIADEVNNALLILANAQQYKQVKAALAQLDIAPLQVLIEATIAEVTLQGTLRHGLEWFFRNNVRDQRLAGRFDLGGGQLGTNQSADSSVSIDPSALAGRLGFTYALFDGAGDVLAVLNTLANDSRARIVSSPNLMVLNNQEASIQVGAQVPVTTQQQQSTTTDSNIINSIEFRDTGVQLTVTPRVNASGLVTMEIEQEVSNVIDQADAGSTLTPTISTRNISSTVAVDSGQTVVLGGLIQENESRSGSGVPGVRNVPVLGFFFGSKSQERDRTELVVLITPRVVRNSAEAGRVTQEFARKMESLKPTPGERLRMRGPEAIAPGGDLQSGPARPQG